jgi:hypothetical protein
MAMILVYTSQIYKAQIPGIEQILLLTYSNVGTKRPGSDRTTMPAFGSGKKFLRELVGLAMLFLLQRIAVR